MQVNQSKKSDSKTTVTISAGEKELLTLKNHVLTHFKDKVKVPGFRSGKVPTELIEKHVDPQAFQTEFLEEAVQNLYPAAIRELELRPVDRPQITIKKFVPYSTLEFEAELEVLGEVKLPDYTKINKTKPAAKITEKDVADVIKSLQKQLAEKKDVNRAAKDGDQVWIDFKGIDAKTKEPIKGADGKDHPLVIGSNTFIPGFEPELIGLKAGDEKTFTLTFPKDYAAKHLANQKVAFTVTVTKVQDVIEPKADDALAAKTGPFKSLADLKADIKKQLAAEKQQQLDREFESELVKEISDTSQLTIPEILVNDQVERILHELTQNLIHRGQTMQEFLEAEGKTEEQYKKEVLRPEAEARVKASIVLSEISSKEKLEVTPEELKLRLDLLRGQHRDEKMQEELNKPEAQRDIAARMLTEKTIDKLTSLVATS